MTITEGTPSNAGEVAALEHAVKGEPLLEVHSGATQPLPRPPTPSPRPRRPPPLPRSMADHQSPRDLAGPESPAGAARRFADRVRVPCPRLTPPPRRRVTVRRTVGYGRLDRVDRRDRRHLACARVVVVRRHDAHRGRPRRTAGNPDRYDPGLVRPGRSSRPRVRPRGPGHPRRHCRRDGCGHSRGVSGRCARTGAPPCEPHAAYPHGLLGRRDLCSDGDLAVDAVIHPRRELPAYPPPGLVDRARLCVAHRHRGAQPSRPAPVANVGHIRTVLISLAVVAVTAVALVATGSRWSPAQRMPSAIAAEQVAAPPGADVAIALTAIGPEGPGLIQRAVFTASDDTGRPVPVILGWPRTARRIRRRCWWCWIPSSRAELCERTLGGSLQGRPVKLTVRDQASGVLVQAVIPAGWCAR